MNTFFGALFAIALLIMPNVASAGEWTTTNDSGCIIWNPMPQEDEVVTWSGECDEDGRSTGQGTLVYEHVENNVPTKQTYIGVMKYGLLHGEGTLYYQNGSKMKGVWLEGVPDGPFIMTDPDGKSRTMTFHQGRPVQEL